MKNIFEKKKDKHQFGGDVIIRTAPDGKVYQLRGNTLIELGATPEPTEPALPLTGGTLSGPIEFDYDGVLIKDGDEHPIIKTTMHDITIGADSRSMADIYFQTTSNGGLFHKHGSKVVPIYTGDNLDDKVNELIDAKLGVIENGSY